MHIEIVSVVEQAESSPFNIKYSFIINSKYFQIIYHAICKINIVYFHAFFKYHFVILFSYLQLLHNQISNYLFLTLIMQRNCKQIKFYFQVKQNSYHNSYNVLFYLQYWKNINTRNSTFSAIIIPDCWYEGWLMNRCQVFP